MENVSFTSLIRPVSSVEFYKATKKISYLNHVCYPWTIKESVKAPDAYTCDIIDCTMCGITDGKKVLMLHICPTMDANSDFSKIKEYLLKKINFKSKKLNAVVLGAKYYPDDNRSYKLFDNFIKFLKSQKVPTTTIRGEEIYEPVDVLYRSKNDEWLIASEYLDKFINKEHPLKLLKRIFPKIQLSDFDQITK